MGRVLSSSPCFAAPIHISSGCWVARPNEPFQEILEAYVIGGPTNKSTVMGLHVYEKKKPHQTPWPAKTRAIGWVYSV